MDRVMEFDHLSKPYKQVPEEIKKLMKLMYEKDITDEKDRYINDYGHVMDLMD